MRGLTILLPTLDEEDALLGVLEEIPVATLEQQGWFVEVLVVDGGSVDGTVQIAQDFGCEVILQTAQSGKGAGMRMAFEKFITSKNSALVMIDADGTYSPKDIPRLLAKLKHYDVVMGSRLRGEISEGAMTRLNYIGNHLLTWLAVSLYGVPITDLCTGAWAFRRESIEQMNLNSIRFEIEAEMFANCSNTGLRITQVPIRYDKRIGEAKLGSVRDGASIFRKLIVRKYFPFPHNDNNT